jgi:hypothetical protein
LDQLVFASGHYGDKRWFAKLVVQGFKASFRFFTLSGFGSVFMFYTRSLVVGDSIDSC